MQHNNLMTAIRIIGSQQLLATHLGLTRKAINNWVNRGTLVPVQHALAIEVLTNSEVLAEDLAPYAKLYITKYKQYIGNKKLQGQVYGTLPQN